MAKEIKNELVLKTDLEGHVRGYCIIFFTVKPKEGEFYENDSEGMAKMLARVVQLTQNKAKFVICETGKLVGDYS